MMGHSTMVFCDICGQTVADQSVKEAIYQLPRVRFRVELCPHCLNTELKRFSEHRGIPGFRKRAAVIFSLSSEEDIPTPAALRTA